MDMFPGVWTKINELCDSRRIISPEEVRNELEKKDDELFAWAKARPWIFRPTDDRILTYAAEVGRRFPRLVHAPLDFLSQSSILRISYHIQLGYLAPLGLINWQVR
jgi:hypothetical protein